MSDRKTAKQAETSGCRAIYRREAGTWKIVHHHTDLSPVMIDLVASLQAKK
jgi:hypothetical protein